MSTTFASQAHVLACCNKNTQNATFVCSRNRLPRAQQKEKLAQAYTTTTSQPKFTRCTHAQGAIVTRGFAADAPAKGNPDGLALDADGVDMEHATGLEKIELEHPTVFEDDYAWIHSTEDGTPENPITVTSRFPQRIVGVTDPEDESIVLWGTIKEGEPPRQLIEGGEYFVLERIGGGDDHH